MNNSAALPVTEYRIETTCNRIFSWSATSPLDLFFTFKRDKGLDIATAMPWAKWEAEEDGFKQLELNSEHEGANTAA